MRCWEKTSSYITMNLFNTCTASMEDLRGFANATCLGSLFLSCMDLGKKENLQIYWVFDFLVKSNSWIDKTVRTGSFKPDHINM